MVNALQLTPLRACMPTDYMLLPAEGCDFQAEADLLCVAATAQLSRALSPSASLFGNTNSMLTSLFHGPTSCCVNMPSGTSTTERIIIAARVIEEGFHPVI